MRYADAGCNYASGGFTADTTISGSTNACSQQQWFTRNSVLNGWQSNVWNFVFSGVTNAPAQNYPSNTNPGNGITTLAQTPVSREKPFLYVDSSGNWYVFSPSLKTNSSGVTWSGGGLGAGTSLPISSFFIATPSSTLAQINQALSSGKNLILTPGIYKYSGSINVTNAKRVVLGLGYATIVPQSGTAGISVADVDGVQVAGVIVDAGPVHSPVLFEVGTPGVANASHAANPTSLNDVFFRVGGANAGSATTALQVDSGNVILDNIWSWRADHGNGIGWTVNTAAHGLVVNGNNVTALGLAVEHFQQEQVLWNGNGGKTIFYQSELPYDPPSQSAWMDGTANGYPSYLVSPSVCTHSAYGLGIYSFFDLGVYITDDNAMVVPDTAGVQVTDVGSVFLSSAGTGEIAHVINGLGGISNVNNADILVPISSYVGSGTCSGTAPATPAAPTDLEAVDEPATGQYPENAVVLTWTASNTSGVTYTVYRSTGSGSAAAIATGVNATVYRDSSALPNTTYTYYLKAVNSGGVSSTASNSQTLTTIASEVAPPTNLVDSVSGTKVSLTWTASTTTGVTYTVYRAVGAGAASPLVNGLTATNYTDTTGQAGATYSYYVVAVNSTSNASPASNTVTVTLNAAGGGGGGTGSDVAAIDAGGAAAASFAADGGFSGGSVYAPGSSVTIPSTLINPAPEAVYQSARQGSFTYTVGGLTSGTAYNVVLHFAELYFSAPGQRVFNVLVNNKVVLPNFDIVKAAGAGLTAVDEQIANVVAANGQIVISFTAVSDQPMHNGIEVQSGSASTPAPAGTSIDAGSASAVGGYGVDADFTGGGTYASGTAVTVPSGLANAAPAAVYRTARQGSFTYSIPVAAGTHTATLQFAELYFNAPGARVFNVKINGTTVLPNFDIAKAAGGGANAVAEHFTGISAQNGAITVSFTGVTDQPMLKRAGVFTYTIPGLTAVASYSVRLHFAEIYWSKVGQRVFNVSIDGTTVLPNFAIVQAAGGPNIAVVKTFTATADSSGHIAIAFTAGFRHRLVNSGVTERERAANVTFGP